MRVVKLKNGKTHILSYSCGKWTLCKVYVDYDNVEYRDDVKTLNSDVCENCRKKILA